MKTQPHPGARLFDLRHFVGDHEKSDQQQKNDRARGRSAFEVENHIGAKESAIEKVDRFGFIVPQFGDPSRGLPKPQLKTHLADEDERDEAEIDALVNEVYHGINSDEREGVKNKASDEK